MTLTQWNPGIALYFKLIIRAGWYRGRPQTRAGLCWPPQPGLQHRVQRQRRERQQRRGRRPPRRPLLPADKHLEHRLSDRRGGPRAVCHLSVAASEPHLKILRPSQCLRLHHRHTAWLPVLDCSPGGGGPVPQAQQDQVILASRWSILLTLASHWSGWCPGPWPYQGTPLPQHPRSRPTHPSTS